MVNVRQEFEREIEDHTVLCAWIRIRRKKVVHLVKGYSDLEYEDFLKEIDVDYNDLYEGQELYGIIWLTNGEWIEREEYDGSEGWILRSRPDIPERCGGEDSATKSASKV